MDKLAARWSRLTQEGKLLGIIVVVIRRRLRTAAPTAELDAPAPGT
jgi:hypothetical protein